MELDHPDLLSDVFATLRLRSRLYFETDLRGDFSIRVPQETRLTRFHLVRRGQCWLQVPGTEPVSLGEDDLAIVPNGAEQVLSRTPGTDPVPLPRLLEAGACRNGVLSHGDGAGTTRILCGFLEFDEAVDHPVLVNLPGLIAVRLEGLGCEPWAAAALRLLCLETDLKGPGMTGIASRVLEIIFIQSLRRLSSERSDEARGFIAALRDARISRALHAIHRAPEAEWSVGGLAGLAGMSRGRFAARFSDLVGMPPIDYLTAWRLMRARTLLANPTLDMAEIAARCGYRSVSSFTRRFKAAFGIGPGAFRRSVRP